MPNQDTQTPVIWGSLVLNPRGKIDIPKSGVRLNTELSWFATTFQELSWHQPYIIEASSASVNST